MNDVQTEKKLTIGASCRAFGHSLRADRSAVFAGADGLFADWADYYDGDENIGAAGEMVERSEFPDGCAVADACPGVTISTLGNPISAEGSPRDGIPE